MRLERSRVSPWKFCLGHVTEEDEKIMGQGRLVGWGSIDRVPGALSKGGQILLTPWMARSKPSNFSGPQFVHL